MVSLLPVQGAWKAPLSVPALSIPQPMDEWSKARYSITFGLAMIIVVRGELRMVSRPC